MDRSWVYRIISYTLISIAAAVLLTPTVATWLGKDEQLPGWVHKHLQKKIMLGLDLQGGLHLVYEVQADKAVTDKADRLAAQIEEKLAKDKKVKGAHVARYGEGAESALKVTFDNKADIKKIDGAFQREFARYLT